MLVGRNASGRWVEAQHLAAGDLLLDADGTFSEVVARSIERSPLTAYNLTVADFHTYFVAGAEAANDNAPAVWVHNCKNLLDGIRHWSGMPENFVESVTTRNPVRNKELLYELRQVESGDWSKVYKDGYNISGQPISIHYFQHSSGKVFDPKIKMGHSNN